MTLGAHHGEEADLEGVLVDGEERLTEVPLRFRFEDDLIAETTTDSEGAFRVRLPRVV